MGLVREPKNVDLYIVDKPDTEEERKAFSEFIKKQKALARKRKVKYKLPWQNKKVTAKA